MHTVKVSLEDRSYIIYIGPGLIDDLGAYIKETLNPARVTVITNSTVWRIYRERIKNSITSKGMALTVLGVPDGEIYKTLERASFLYKELVEACATRKDPIVALGGGVIGDLAGFVAGTYMRGVPLVHVPTTLVAQSDSSIGGKTAVDIEQGKNLVGVFHQPAFVLTDTDVLNALPENEFSQGMAEVIKTAFIDSEQRVRFLEENKEHINSRHPAVLSDLVAGAAAYKARIVERDERDMTDVRAVLNYGHTVGHAIEVIGSFEKYLHGSAIAIGMMCEALISSLVTGLDKNTAKRQEDLLKEFGLPTMLPRDMRIDGIINAMRRDKKRVSERLTFALLDEIGKPDIIEVDNITVKKALEEMPRG